MTIDALGPVMPEVRAPDWDGHTGCACRRLMNDPGAPWLAFSVPRGPFKAFVSPEQLARAGVDLAAVERAALERLAASPPPRRRMDLGRAPDVVPVVMVEGERAAACAAEPTTLRALHADLGGPLAVGIPTTGQLVATALTTAMRFPIHNVTRHLFESAPAEVRLTPRLLVVMDGAPVGWVRTAADEAGRAPPPPAPAPAPRAAAPAPAPLAAAAPGPDFAALAGAAYPGGAPGPRAAMDTLWKALFELPRWLFAVDPRDPTRPYVAERGGQRWAFVFTDAGHLERFLAQNGLRGAGELLFLEMSAAGARRWIEEAGARGDVAGAQFNFAGPGWFAPHRALGAIHAHLFG